MTIDADSYLDAFDKIAAGHDPLNSDGVSGAQTTDLVARGLARGRILRSAAFRLAIKHLRRRMRLPELGRENTRFSAGSSQQTAAE